VLFGQHFAQEILGCNVIVKLREQRAAVFRRGCPDSKHCCTIASRQDGRAIAGQGAPPRASVRAANQDLQQLRPCGEGGATGSSSGAASSPFG
jgi:hypothetical protein